MRAIGKGDKGIDVEQWQYFLMGEEYYIVRATGTFDDVTHSASFMFQQSNGLHADGIVGKNTYKKAVELGYVFDADISADEETENTQTGEINIKSADYPPKPTFKGLTKEKTAKIFGKIEYTADSNGKIKVTNNWVKENIITINIPQLNKLGQKWGHKNGDILFNKKAAKQMIALWNAWEEADLLKYITDWCCSYSMRFIRGYTNRLSNHAYGTAFDINIRSNALGKMPPLVGQPGSLRKLVPIANELGFFWGGHFRRRKDGMHFEIAEIKEVV